MFLLCPCLCPYLCPCLCPSLCPCLCPSLCPCLCPSSAPVSVPVSAPVSVPASAPVCVPVFAPVSVPALPLSVFLSLPLSVSLSLPLSLFLVFAATAATASGNGHLTENKAPSAELWDSREETQMISAYGHNINESSVLWLWYLSLPHFGVVVVDISIDHNLLKALRALQGLQLALKTLQRLQ